MFLFEYFFLFSFSLVNSKRYYAFVETLFVIDRDYFPQPSMMSYEEYVRAMVDTTNIVQCTFEKIFSMESGVALGLSISKWSRCEDRNDRFWHRLSEHRRAEITTTAWLRICASSGSGRLRAVCRTRRKPEMLMSTVDTTRLSCSGISRGKDPRVLRVTRCSKAYVIQNSVSWRSSLSQHVGDVVWQRWCTSFHIRMPLSISRTSSDINWDWNIKVQRHALASRTCQWWPNLILCLSNKHVGRSVRTPGSMITSVSSRVCSTNLRVINRFEINSPRCPENEWKAISRRRWPNEPLTSAMK